MEGNGVVSFFGGQFGGFHPINDEVIMKTKQASLTRDICRGKSDYCFDNAEDVARGVFSVEGDDRDATNLLPGWSDDRPLLLLDVEPCDGAIHIGPNSSWYPWIHRACSRI